MVKGKVVLVFILLGFIISCETSDPPKEQDYPNIIFISIDDLRPELSAYGYDNIITPNLDRLAKKSVVFKNAFAQEPTCGPSRASILTGLRPDSSLVFDIFTPIRTVRPNVLTLPQHLKDNGYTTLSYGKVYHHKSEDDSLGWSQPAWKASLNNLRGYLDPENIARINDAGNSVFYESMDVHDTLYEDGKTVSKALERLSLLKEEVNNPFFLAIGLFKPHLPFIAPKKYWDLYDSSKIQLPERYFHPGDRYMTTAYNWGGEISSYEGAEKEQEIVEVVSENGSLTIDTVPRMTENTAKKLIHGYYASASYADAQLGRVLDALETTKSTRETIIVLWSDHGWFLGELGEWCKHGLYDWETRATLMISSSEVPKGKSVQDIVELVDIYPSICELAGVDLPSHLQGSSLAKYVTGEGNSSNQGFAFTQYVRDYYTSEGLVGKGYFQGYSVRSDSIRYTEWRLKSQMDSVVSKELYDYSIEPLEYDNLAENDQYESIRLQHEDLISKHFFNTN